jgi:DNA-binding transcriptional LysR family regulator
MLDIERLRVLRTVATYGSVSGAADILHVTTSAVSQQLAKLERETGQKLIERNGRGIRLTDAARLLVSHATEILDRVERAQADLEAHKGAVVGTLSVAAFPTAARGLLPAAGAELGAVHPRLSVQFREAEPHVSVSQVTRGEVDLAVVQDWFNVPLAIPPELEKAAVTDDIADIAVPANSPLADREIIGLDELAGARWISQSEGAICRDWLMLTMRRRDLEPVIAHVADEYATQLAMVAAGLGHAVLPRLGRADVPPDVKLVRVEPALTRHVYAIWRREAARRPAIRATVDAICKAAAPTGTDRQSR